MTLGFCVDGLVSPALCTTSLETWEHEGHDRSGQCSSQVLYWDLQHSSRGVTQHFFRNCSHCTSDYLLLSAMLWKLIFSHFKSCLHAFPLLFWRTAILFNCCSLTRYVLAKGQILNTMLWWILCFSCFSEGTCKPDKFSLQTKKL